ncbi:MAG: hypothetical protein EAX90_00120 [Candidatus Heimdallarchaeota archaeon]|nr:hypothetical protein [Candidatus Heimdallarchaeota archaeon]
MNKKIFTTAFIIATILTVAFVVKPQMSHAAVEELLVYDRICPSGEVFQGSIQSFGGTIYNNRTIDTYRLNAIRVDIYNDTKKGPLPEFNYVTEFDETDVRYILEPGEAITVFFQHEIDLRLERNFTFQIHLLYFNFESQVETPNDIQIGENATVHVIYDRPDAPNYIWVVMALLIAGIIAFIVLGIVGWVRDRRAK